MEEAIGKRTRKKTPGRDARTIPARWFYGASLALICLGFALRAYQLGTRQLWLDEAFSHHIATLPNWLPSVIVDNTPPLYYLLLRGWVRFAGTSEASLRLTSTISGTLFIGLVIWAGTLLFNRHAGLWAGLVVTLSPIQIYYSQEARVYALLDVILLLVLIFMWRANVINNWREWMLLTASLVVAFYSHYLSFLVVPAGFILPLVMPGKRTRLRYLLSVTAGCLAFAPWLLYSFIIADRPLVGTAWIAEIWNETPRLLAIPLSLEIFGFGSHAGLVPLWMRQFSLVEFPVMIRILGLMALAGVALVVARSRDDKTFALSALDARKLWLGAYLLVPLVLLWLISFVRPIYAVGRYDFLAYPPFPLLIGFGLGKLQLNRRPILVGVLAAGLLVPCAVKLYLYFQAVDYSKPAASAQKIDIEARNEDVVVFTGLRGLTTLYYLNRLGYTWQDGFCRNPSGRSFYCRMYPRATELTPAASDIGNTEGSREIARAEVEDYLAHFDSSSGVFWVVLAGSTTLSNSDRYLFEELLDRGLKQVEDQASSNLLIAKMRFNDRRQ